MRTSRSMTALARPVAATRPGGGFGSGGGGGLQGVLACEVEARCGGCALACQPHALGVLHHGLGGFGGWAAADEPMRALVQTMHDVLPPPLRC